MEKASGDVPLADNSITVHTKPYEIKTVKINFPATTNATAVH